MHADIAVGDNITDDTRQWRPLIARGEILTAHHRRFFEANHHSARRATLLRRERAILSI